MPAYIYRVSQWLEKRFNAKGGQVVTDLDPSLGVEMSFPVGVEDRYLQGYNRFAVVAFQAAVAANFSRSRIRNPVGSNVVIVLEQLSLFTSGAADAPFVTWGPVTTDLTTLITLSFTRMDPRGNPQPTAVVSVNAQASGGQGFLQRGLLVTTNSDYINQPDQQIPILPGQAVDVQSTVANNPMTTTFMWRERALELSELT